MNTSGAAVDAGGGVVECAAEAAAAAKVVSSTSGVNGIPKLDARGLGVVGNFCSVALKKPEDPAATVTAFRKPLYPTIDARDSTLISGSVGGVESIRYLDETVYAGEGGIGKSRVFEAADEVLSADLGRELDLRFL